jgi:hypothetical protein
MTIVEKQLELLIEKLKGKSVYENLKNISLGKEKDSIREVVGISSLLTHALIEMKIDKNYKMLVASLYERLGILIYNLK